MACEARRELDEMVCRCGKRWDAKDPDPPKCQQPPPPTHFIIASTPHNPLPRHEARRFYPLPETPTRPKRAIAALIPAELSQPRAREMAAAYQAAIHAGASPWMAMQAAYRLFITTLP